MESIFRSIRCGMLLFVLPVAIPAHAQEVRYSWFDIAYLQQDVGRAGSLTDSLIDQTVSVDASDGDGIRFRGSVGTWNNLYAFFDFASSDVDVSAVVSNSQGDFPATDEFDLTSIRGGVGFKYSLTVSTDLYAEVTYDSLDFDFGSFAGENFDADQQDVGGAVGFRAMLGDRFEARVHARFTNAGDVDLSTGEFDSDTLYGAGFGYTLMRGLSITGDYEAGEVDSWSIGFRLDLDED